MVELLLTSKRDWLLQVQLKMSRRKPALDELGRK
jgi:hypothetical protein